MANIIKSDATLRAIKPPATGREIWRDQRVSGLQLQVTSRGVMTWYLVAKFKGKAERFNLGHYVRGEDAEGQLATVRAEAATLADKLRAGAHPEIERKAAQAADEERQRDSFAAVRKRFLERHAAQKKPRTAAAYKHALESARLKEWEQRPVRDITRRDVLDLLDRIAVQDKAPIMANRQLAYLRKFFNWCAEVDILREGEPIPTDRVKPPQRKEKPRERWLSRAEVALLWKVAGGQAYPFGPFVRLLLATGQRRDEVATIRRGDVQGDRWTQADNKGGRVHIVPLHPIAQTLLAGLPEIKDTTLVFTTTGKTAISGFSKYKLALDKAIEAIKAKEGLTGVFDEPWTLHDLRRTMTTHMREMRISRDVCSKLLNHAPKGVTASVYDQWEMIDEKTEAMKAWGALLLEITSSKPANVVKLRRAKK